MIKSKEKNAFTLVELLAVIVILAIILVIAVPKVMSVIEDSKKATLESTAKMIASSAEKQKVQNTVLGNSDAITCDSVAKINKGDYANCNIDFDNNTAKVTIEGKGKFEGLYVCNGTKTTAVASEEECPPAFETDDWLTIVNKVKSGTYPYQVGDMKEVDLGTELGVHTLRVANTTSCSEEWMQDEEKSQTACGFVLEFADIITTYNMNPAGEYSGTQYDYGTNLGGWPASAMRTYVNGEIYNAMPEALRNGIINTYVVSGHGSKGTTGNIEDENAGVLEDGNYWSKDKLYLLSPQEIYGTSFTSIYDTSSGTSRQLDYYATYQGEDYTGVSATNYDGAIKQSSWWWVRSVDSSDDYDFFNVGGIGGWSYDSAHCSRGVSPAFRIG